MSATTRDTRPWAPGTPSQIGSPSLLSHCSSPRPELGTEHSPAALYPSPAGPPELGSSMSSRRPPWPSLSLAVRAPNPPFFSAEHPSSLLVEGPHLPGSLLVSPWDSLGPSRPSIGYPHKLEEPGHGSARVSSPVPCPLLVGSHGPTSSPGQHLLRLPLGHPLAPHPRFCPGMTHPWVFCQEVGFFGQ